MKIENSEVTLYILDEHDTMWTDYQHQHIADCMRQIPEAFKNFAKEKRHKTSSEKATIKDLSKMMQGKLTPTHLAHFM